MKKIAALILTAALILSMAACGKNVDSPVTQPKSIEWETRENVTLDIPEFELESVSHNGLTATFELIKDPFGISLDNARELFADTHEISKTSWNEYIAISEDIFDGNWMYGHHYKLTEEITFDSKTDKPSVLVQTNMYTPISSSPSAFLIVFSDMDVNLDSQKEVYEMLKGLLGEAWANYLTYAKDANGKDLFNGELTSGFELKDYVQIGNYKLSCYRYMDNSSVTFRVQIEREGFNYCSIYSGNYVSKYDDTFKYPINSVFPAITVDYLDYYHAYEEFFALHNADKLPNSMINSISINCSDYGDYKSYYVSIDAMMYSEEDVSAEGDTFSTALDISEDTNGNITEVLIRAYGEDILPVYENMTEQEIMDIVKPVLSQKLSYLLPGIELFDDEWKVGEMQMFEGTHTIEGFDIEFDYLLDISVKPEGYISWNVQLTYDAE